MTTIAWDGKSLAGDRQRSMRNTPIPATKVFKLSSPKRIGNVDDVVMFGCAGDSFEAVAFHSWAEIGGLPPAVKDMDIIAIDAWGQSWLAINGYGFVQIKRANWAIGSGADYAMGAMARGASAEEAVQVACDLDVNSGMGVDLLELPMRQLA